MPGFDRTGPEGKGSRTGRAFGKCNPESQSSDKDSTTLDEKDVRGAGKGFGRGRGSFRGQGRGLGRNR